MNLIKKRFFGMMLLLAATLPTYAQQPEVVTLPQPGSGLVVFKIAFRNGSVTDPVGKEGLTYLTARALTETSSERFPKAYRDSVFYPMAASYTAFTDKEMTTFTFRVHRDFLGEYYRLIEDLLLRPTFAEADVARVRSNAENYVSQVLKASSDEDYSKLLLEDRLFAGTRYQHPKFGTVEGLAAIGRDDVARHYRQYFTRHNVLLGAAGDYPADFPAQLRSTVAQLPDTRPELSGPPEPQAPQGLQVTLVPKEENLGTAIFTGYPLAADRSSPDWPALMVVNSYLGEHRKSYSKLYELIREQRSMNYGDYTYIEWYEAGGRNQLPLTGFPRSANYFAIWIRPVQTAYSLRSQYAELSDVEVGHAPFALRMALYEIDRVRREGLTKEEFELTRRFLRSYTKLYVQTPERRLGFLMDSRFYGLEDYIGELDAALAKLTVDDVNAAARKYLRVEDMYVAMITDTEEVEPLRDLLLNDAPSPMRYADVVRESLPAKVFELDTRMQSFPLRVETVDVLTSQDTFLRGAEQP